MNFDWLTNLLPFLNATGVPLLAIGIMVLVRAYQKSIDTYRKRAEELEAALEKVQDENDKLRERVNQIQEDYFGTVDRMNTVVDKTTKAMAELQTRKIALLSKPEATPKDNILSDVKKINEALETMQDLIRVNKQFKNAFRRTAMNIGDEIQEIEERFQTLASRIGEIAEQIGDTKSRVTVVSVLTADETLAKVGPEIESQPRGIVTTEERVLLSPPSNDL